MLIPVYGTEAYLPRCLDSVLRQSLSDLEIVIVDDASPGCVQKIARQYQERDPRIRLYSHEVNRGLFLTRMTAVRKARGRYLAFLDSDDYLSADFLRSLVSRAEETGAEVIFGRTVREEEGERFIFNFHESSFFFDRLTREELRERFLRQELYCYGWHTVWNKLYRRELIERCLPYLSGVHRHLVMTEDLLFSFVFLLEAESASSVENEAVFYCANRSSATGTESLTAEQFAKHLQDLCFVFDFLETHLERMHGTEEERRHLVRARQRYRRIWERRLRKERMSALSRGKLREALRKLAPEPGEGTSASDGFFESVRTPWRGSLTWMKEQILSGPETVISFDLFDTLLLRPLSRPEDLFLLLDPEYASASGSGVPFSRMRIEAEREARRNAGDKDAAEDVTLAEIYACMGQLFGLPETVRSRMLQRELELEYRLICPRRAGKELFETACASGKTVILVSDMYLPRTALEKMLRKCGIRGYSQLFLSSEERKRKGTGGLFRKVLSFCPGQKVLHIGDSWECDVVSAERCGIRTLFFPKTVEVYEGRIEDCPTGRCHSMGRTFFPEMERSAEPLPLRCAEALAANRLFDDPYRPFHPGSDFHVSPFLTGYAVLGRYLLGLSVWLKQRFEVYGVRKAVFLLRDGALAAAALPVLFSEKELPEIHLLPVSRRALLPVLLETKAEWLSPPVEPCAHTPLSLCELFSFAMEPVRSDDLAAVIRNGGLRPESRFPDADSCRVFLNWFYEHLYHRESHRKAASLTERFYREHLQSGTAVFDLGCSGRLLLGLARCTGHPFSAFYLYEDADISSCLRAAGAFSIETFLDAAPAGPALIREHLFSSDGQPLTGFREEAGTPVPVYAGPERTPADTEAVRQMHEGALAFLRDYRANFGAFPEMLRIPAGLSAAPFESYLLDTSSADRQIVGGALAEDLVFGGRNAIPAADFWEQAAAEFHRRNGIVEEIKTGGSGPEAAELVMRDQPFLRRAALMLLLDRKRLLRAVKRRAAGMFDRKGRS